MFLKSVLKLIKHHDWLAESVMKWDVKLALSQNKLTTYSQAHVPVFHFLSQVTGDSSLPQKLVLSQKPVSQEI